MQHNFNVNCLIGDFIKYYGTTRFSRIYKQQKNPTDIIFDIAVDDIRENSSNILITNGIIQEFDYANMTYEGDDRNSVIHISKKVKVCKASYMIHIKYTKAGDTYTAIAIYVYMNDLSKYDSIQRDIPNDIYFW